MGNYTKAIWITIALEYILLYIVAAMVSEDISSLLRPGILLVPLFVIVPSFLLSMLVIVLFYKEGQESKTVFICQILGLVIALGAFGWNQYENWHRQKYYGNIDYNNWSIDYSRDKEKAVLKGALKTLESKFTDPNAIRLTAHWLYTTDSLVDAAPQPFYTIYFTYHLGGDTSRKYFSKLTGFKNRYTVGLLNIPPAGNTEYMQLQTQKEAEKQVILQEVAEEVLNNPNPDIDSVNEMLRKVSAN